MVSSHIGTCTGTNQLLKKMERITIKPKLQNMSVGDVCEFPILKATSVMNTVSQRLIQERLDGKRFAVRRDWDKKKVYVTRVE